MLSLFEEYNIVLGTLWTDDSVIQ